MGLGVFDHVFYGCSWFLYVFMKHSLMDLGAKLVEFYLFLGEVVVLVLVQFVKTFYTVAALLATTGIQRVYDLMELMIH